MKASLLNSGHLRTCLSHFVTGVTVVSYHARGKVRGITVNSFTSVSLEPPLILVSLARSTSAVDHLSRAPFTINVLQNSQVDLALHFAGRPTDSAEVEWRSRGDDLAPTLEGALATFRCRPWQSYDAGDHGLQLGQVIEAAIHGNGEPLLFARGRFTMASVRRHDAAHGNEDSKRWVVQVSGRAPVKWTSVGGASPRSIDGGRDDDPSPCTTAA